MSALYPQGVGNMIAITLKDGRRLVERVDYPCGHARNRMSDEQVMNKFHALAAPLISRDRADALAAYVWELDKVHNCSSLPTLLALS